MALSATRPVDLAPYPQREWRDNQWYTVNVIDHGAHRRLPVVRKNGEFYVLNETMAAVGKMSPWDYYDKVVRRDATTFEIKYW